MENNGRNIHIQTLATMNPSADSYEDLFTICRQLRLPASEIQEQYRRTVFNILTGNVDDHSKNFSFMMREDGVWHITPAYDLTFTVDLDAPAYVSKHSLTIGGKNDEIMTADLLAYAKINGIKSAGSIPSEVKVAISHFPDYTQNAGIQEQWTERINSYLSSTT